jgi:cyclohexanecarboxylate-CoA ligase
MLDERRLWPLIEARAAATPDARMLVDQDGRERTFAAYKERAERVAAALAGRGVGRDDVVAWQLPTWIEARVCLDFLDSRSSEPGAILGRGESP